MDKGQEMSDELAHDALDRMHRAFKRGTGCHLTAEMIFALSVTFMGELWQAERPEPEETENEDNG